MKNLIVSTCLSLLVISFGVNSAEFNLNSSVNKKTAYIFAKKFRQSIYKKTLKLAKQSPSSLAAKFITSEDRGFYQKLVAQSQMNHFPTPLFTGGEWRIRVGKKYLIHYSYEDVAKGVLWINKTPFKLRHYTSYKQLVDHFSYFLKKNFPVEQKVSLFDFLMPSAHAFLSASIEDILVVSVSGYISVNYEEADFIHDDDHYAKLLVDTLAKELDQSASECSANKNMLEASAGVLSESLREIFDSLKNKKSFDEYKIISSLLAKHAKNKDDLYFHADFRKEHPECISAAKLKDKHCNNLKDDYYIDDDVPLAGSFAKDLSFAPEVAYQINMNTKLNSAFDSDCARLVRSLLPRAYMPDTRELYDAHIKKVCSKVDRLKQCLTQVDKIHTNHTGNKRFYIGEDEIDGSNSTFDKFQTQETLSR